MKMTKFKPIITLLFTILITGSLSNCTMNELEVEPSGNSFNDQTDSFARTGGSSTTCAECDFIVSSYVTDGKQLNIKPGQVICLDANIKYDRLVFRNIVGTKSQPITIRNCGGVAKIYSKEAFGLKFENSKDFKLMGDGDGPGTYGIKVSTEKGFFVTMEKFTTDFEISQIEVAGPSPNGKGATAGFAGIGVKTSPYQDCDLFTDPSRKAWVMRNVNIHDNYIHDVGGEGMYIGHGFWTGRKESECPGVTYSHAIKNVRVYNNRIENTGRDGIQIKNTDENVEVYNNIIRNYGTLDESAHDEGLFLGEGTVGKYYNNLIDKGTGNGCMIQGLGDITLVNNVILNSGENGIYVSMSSYGKRLPSGYFNIFNNTIYNSKDNGLIFYNEEGGTKRFINNLVVNAKNHIGKGASLVTSNNILTNDLNEVKFANSSLSDFRVSNGSKVIDAGADLRSYGVTTDFEGNPRPSGAAFDIGAYESQSSSSNPEPEPTPTPEPEPTPTPTPDDPIVKEPDTPNTGGKVKWRRHNFHSGWWR